MTLLALISRRLSLLCRVIGALCLVLMVLVTMLDIGTRLLFTLSGGAFLYYIRGGAELVSYLMFIGLFAGLAAYVEQAQIVVDILSQHWQAKYKARLAGVALLLLALLGVVLMVGLINQALNAQRYGEVSQDLRLPMASLYWSGVALAGILSCRSLIEGVFSVVGRQYHQEYEKGL